MGRGGAIWWYGSTSNDTGMVVGRGLVGFCQG